MRIIENNWFPNLTAIVSELVSLKKLLRTGP